MDIKDAAKVIHNLQNRPFICGMNEIVLDNGYVILKKEEYERLRKWENDVKNRLEELQQYRALGTLEELLEAIENQI